MNSLVLWQQAYNMQKASQADFCPVFGSKRTAVKAFPGSKIPLATDTKETTAAKWNRPSFTGTCFNIHPDLLIQCTFVIQRATIEYTFSVQTKSIRSKFNKYLQIFPKSDERSCPACMGSLLAGAIGCLALVRSSRQNATTPFLNL